MMVFSCLVRRDRLGCLRVVVVVHPLVGVSWNGRGGCWWIVGTLLGPERTGIGGAVRFPFLFVSFSGPACCQTAATVVGVGGGVGLVFGLLFENCTVDASIFVAKFLRAHGGCLGTRSR